MNMIADNVILGRDCIYSTDSQQTGLNNNVLVCGGSGSGKTMSVTEPRILQTHTSSLVVTVTKRRIVNKYIPLMRSRGYRILDLNFINPSQSNICYDPLRYVKTNSDISHLSEAIVKSDPRKEKSNADPYWDEAAGSLLSAEIAYVLTLDPSASFADVLALHNLIDFSERGDSLYTSLDEKFDRLIRRDPHCFAACCWKSFKKLPIKTASCVFGALNTVLDTLFPPELREMMKTREPIDFSQIASQKTVLFISTSAVNPAMHRFVNLFYAQIFKQLFEFAEAQPDGILPVPVHVLCDDFATGSRIANFAEYISIFREKLISVTLLLQSESQLRAMYGSDDSTTIINNCDSYLYLGGMDLQTAQSVSLRANVPLDEVLYLPIGQEILFRRGQRPIHTARYDTLQDKLYQKVTAQYERQTRKNLLAAAK